jgi:hypothetical protein
MFMCMYVYVIMWRYLLLYPLYYVYKMYMIYVISIDGLRFTDKRVGVRTIHCISTCIKSRNWGNLQYMKTITNRIHPSTKPIIKYHNIDEPHEPRGCFKRREKRTVLGRVSEGQKSETSTTVCKVSSPMLFLFCLYR